MSQEAGPAWGAPLWARFVQGGADPEPRTPSRAWTLPNGLPSLPPPPGSVSGCPLPYDWESRRYAAFDVETTGLDSAKDRVVELGLLLFRFDPEGAIVEDGQLSSLVNPEGSIPESATAIHGITDLDVSQAPFFGELAEELDGLLADRVLVAHNAPFDEAFLRAEFSRLGRVAREREVADSLVLARLAFPSLRSYALGRAAFALGIEVGTSHRALDDARTCMRLFSRSARVLAGACP